MRADGSLIVVTKVDWRASLAADDGVRVRPGCTADDIKRCEDALETSVPGALRALYLLSDGLWDEPGQWFVIWPLGELVERNRMAWQVEGAQRKAWVGFGDDGTGNPFCFARSEGEAVYHWSPTDQESTWLAGDAAAFWAAWTSGQLRPH
jgi:SMI1/KNR4 family protein SUKH-1